MISLISQNINNDPYKDPLKFIDTLSGKKHIVFYYENYNFGKKIQYRFIRNGLVKGESCIFATHNNDIDQIKFEMTNYFINVEDYTERGLLKIFKIPDVMKHPKGVISGGKEILDKMFSGMNFHFRAVVRMINKLNTKEEIRANLALEQYYHSNIEKFDGLMLCPYDVSHNPIDTNGKWVKTILENHHSAIFVTDAIEEGIAFDMN
jgi:hypothetical protein